jgi:hypothetical protein
MYYYKLFEIVYEKPTYKNTFFINENLQINIKIYSYA